MKQILLVPDSFKGTLTSRQVCETMAEQLHLVFPEADITSLPVADGGEGSVDAFLAAAGGERVELPVTGPSESRYGAFTASFLMGKPPSSRWPPAPVSLWRRTAWTRSGPPPTA